jgi:hypothetical protein
MRADEGTTSQIEALVHETYRRMSTAGATPSAVFGHPDVAVAGSGQGELMYGPETVGQVSDHIATWGFDWVAEQMTVWQEGQVAWAQILGHVVTRRDGVEDSVPYWTTGVFAREPDGTWAWRYWGGSEPQEQARV